MWFVLMGLGRKKIIKAEWSWKVNGAIFLHLLSYCTNLTHRLTLISITRRLIDKFSRNNYTERRFVFAVFSSFKFCYFLPFSVSQPHNLLRVYGCVFVSLYIALTCFISLILPPFKTVLVFFSLYVIFLFFSAIMHYIIPMHLSYCCD